jgi:hypothetical protein
VNGKALVLTQKPSGAVIKTGPRRIAEKLLRHCQFPGFRTNHAMTAANTPLRPYKCAYSSTHSEQTMKPASPGGPAHWKGMLMTEIGFEHVDVVWKQYNFAVYGRTKARKKASKPIL